MIWSDKYAPNNLKEIIGEKPPLIKLQDLILNYKKNRKSIILHGPTGTGKTSSIHAIAKENNLTILEVNASDIRNKKAILEFFGDSLNQTTLFSKGKVILFDDADALSGTKDRGGAQAIMSLIETSEFPIILTTTDPWGSKLSKLRKKSELIEFKPSTYLEIIEVLKKICEKEQIKVTESVLKKIAIRNEGDIRSSINDLQTAATGKTELNEINMEDIGYREREESILKLLQLIFKSKETKLINRAIENVNFKLDEILLWVEENLPSEYYGNELFEAFERLSKADIFRGRIRKNQYWRFLVYQKILMSLGIALAKESPKNRSVDYIRSKRILKLWIAKIKYAKRKEKAQEIAQQIHVSTKRVLSEVMPYCKEFI
jgi:replication factor C large subunit